jgi:hypothetical protein
MFITLLPAVAKVLVPLIGDETRRFSGTCLCVMADLEAALLPPCVLLRRQERTNDHQTHS